MSRLFFAVLMASCCLLANASHAASPVSSGFLEGQLKVLASKGAHLADENQPTPPRANYSEYPLVVLSKDGREEVTRIKVDDNGHYRVSLPPGDYVLALKGPSPKRIQQQQRPFTVVSQKTVRMDMEIMTDLSVSGAPR